MALGRSPEYHWNQIISKSVHRFSRESRLKLFFLFIALEAILFNRANCLSSFCRQSPMEHSCIIISKSMHWLSTGFEGFFLFLALVVILFNGAEQFEQFWYKITEGPFL